MNTLFMETLSKHYHLKTFLTDFYGYTLLLTITSPQRGPKPPFKFSVYVLFHDFPSQE